LVVKNIQQNLCSKCFKCYNLCPMDVFVIEDNNVKIKYKEDCQSCYLCVYECPSHAVKVEPDRAKEIFDIYDKKI